MTTLSEKVNIEVEARADKGKNSCRRLRAAGRIPANVYGLDLAPFPVAVDPDRVEGVLRTDSGRNTILKLTLSGAQETRDVMLRELQRDPVSDLLIHVDFVRVDLEKRLTVSVPIRLVGVPEGVKNEGGILDFVQRTVEVSCLPFDIPDGLELDISGLHLNQNASVKDLSPGANIEIVDDESTILVVVAHSRAEVVEEAVAEGEEDEVAAEGEEGEAEAGTGKEGDEKAEESKE
jgi:large subunit ribosomal protein L25